MHFQVLFIHPAECPLCDTADLDKPTLAEHVITNHTKSDNSWGTLLDSFTTVGPTFFSHVVAERTSARQLYTPGCILVRGGHA